MNIRTARSLLINITLTLTGVLIGSYIGDINSYQGDFHIPWIKHDCLQGPLTSKMVVPIIKEVKNDMRKAMGQVSNETKMDKGPISVSLGRKKVEGGIFHPSQNKTRDEGIIRNIRKVVILTHRRSGSSFLAELFKQNPDVFFIFEPLVPVAERHGDLDVPIVGPAYISEILNCRFNTSTYLNQVTTMKGWRWQSVFRGIQQFQAIPTICASKKIVGTKIIRLKDLSDIVPYVDEDTAVLFLARDPRGILNSRNNENEEYKNQTLELKKKDMETDCNNILTSINFIKDLSTNKKQLRTFPLVKQVLYEDFAFNPLNKTKELYKSLNIHFHTAVQKWIQDNTLSASRSASVYGTTRNSRSVPFKWRNQLNHEELNMIQNITNCAKVIKLLGFQLV